MGLDRFDVAHDVRADRGSRTGGAVGSVGITHASDAEGGGAVAGTAPLELALGRGVHLGALTAVLADRYGDRPAVEDPAPTPGLDDGPVRSYRQLDDAVGRLAAVLAARGCAADERVLVAVDNRIDVALHLFALARLGAVPVPVNDRLTAGELAAITTVTGASAAVADAAVADRLPDGLEVVTADTVAEDLRARPHRRLGAGRDADADAVAVLLTTSGTTGVPKAAALTSRGLLSSLGPLVAAPIGWGRGPRAGRDRVFAALPLTHVMGLSTLLAAMTAGVRLVRRTRFDASEALQVIETAQPNVVVGVPTMYDDLERAGAAARDLSSVQMWVSSADVMPTDRARRFQRYGAAARVAGRAVGTAAFVDVYGMVELSGAAAVRIFPPSPVGTVALPSFAVALPGTEVRAVDPAGRPVPRGTVGELQWRGAGVLAGYEGRSDEGPEGAGWFSSGDHARVWPGGLFRFVGRSRDRLKVGGFSVFPAEVEQELRGAPGVGDLAVVGVPDDRLGERLVAVVVPGEGFDDAAFLTWAEEHTAGYRRPSAVVEVDELPRGAHGKLDRDAATELAIGASGSS
jgi:acyl-CoA synthetase (AMP-forming)/AMP-acid ligase II